MHKHVSEQFVQGLHQPNMLHTQKACLTESYARCVLLNSCLGKESSKPLLSFDSASSSLEEQVVAIQDAVRKLEALLQGFGVGLARFFL